MSDSSVEKSTFDFPGLTIGDISVPVPIVQGGMGLGVSLAGLASAVANEGGIGVISAVGIGMFDKRFETEPHKTNLACLREEIQKARTMTDAALGFNIMVALSNYTDYVREAHEEGIDIVFSGAGLPFDLPGSLVPGKKRPKLVPIVSSGRAAAMICRRWEKRFNVMPDAFVVEGPLAGGHLGFSKEQIEDPEFALEKILVDVLENLKPFTTEQGTPMPVIAAGGVYNGEDIHKMLSLGASGVQMGTRFVATEECDVSDAFKQAYIDCTEDDICIINSPVGLPGRVIRNEFVEKFIREHNIRFRCPYSCITSCNRDKAAFCIAEALLNAKTGNLDKGFAFAGAKAHRIDRIITVHELIEQLRAEYSQAEQKTHSEQVSN